MNYRIVLKICGTFSLKNLQFCDEMFVPMERTDKKNYVWRPFAQMASGNNPDSCFHLSISLLLVNKECQKHPSVGADIDMFTRPFVSCYVWGGKVSYYSTRNVLA